MIGGLVPRGGLSLLRSGALWEARRMAYGREPDLPSTLVLTGVMAVGKSTVADLWRPSSDGRSTCGATCSGR